MNLRRLLRRRAPLATVTAEATTDEWPALRHDHTFDYTADDFAQPPTVYMPPELTHLAAMLSDFSPERTQVLRESETPNGWPEWWERRFYATPEDWDVFKGICLEALTNYHDDGIPIENTLFVCVQDIERERRDAALD